MDTLTRLEAIEEIRQLKARYIRAVDTKDYTLFRSVFTDDAVVDNSDTLAAMSPERLRALLPIPGATADPPPGWTNIDDFVAVVAAINEGAYSLHYGVLPEITVHSDDEAEGIWKMEDIVVWQDGAPAGTPIAGVRRLHGYGQYHERYRKTDGAWRIYYCRLTRMEVTFDRN